MQERPEAFSISSFAIKGRGEGSVQGGKCDRPGDTAPFFLIIESSRTKDQRDDLILHFRGKTNIQEAALRTNTHTHTL